MLAVPDYWKIPVADEAATDLTKEVPYNLEVIFQLKQLFLELQKILTAVGSIDIPMDITWEYTKEGKREEVGEVDEDKPLIVPRKFIAGLVAERQ